MLKFPSRLSIVKSRGIARELKLLHHRLRPALLSFEQESHVNLEFDELGGLILIASWRLLKQ